MITVVTGGELVGMALLDITLLEGGVLMLVCCSAGSTAVDVVSDVESTGSRSVSSLMVTPSTIVARCRGDVDKGSCPKHSSMEA